MIISHGVTCHGASGCAGTWGDSTRRRCGRAGDYLAWVATLLPVRRLLAQDVAATLHGS